MFRTIVVNFVCGVLEPFRTDYSECSCELCLEARDNFLEQEAEHEAGLYDFELDEKGDLLADSLGIPPEQLDNGRCGCDRPRWSVLPCGHCACRCACEVDGCAANKLWRDEQDSWCGCAQPGRNGVLECGHCACGYGCFEVVRNGSDAPMQKVPCA